MTNVLMTINEEAIVAYAHPYSIIEKSKYADII